MGGSREGRHAHHAISRFKPSYRGRYRFNPLYAYGRIFVRSFFTLQKRETLLAKPGCENTKNVWCYWKKIVAISLALALTGGPIAFAAQIAANMYAEQCAARGANGKGDGPEREYMAPPPAPFTIDWQGKSDSWIGAVIGKGGPAVGMTAGMPAHPALEQRPGQGTNSISKD
jgi:hypothetical protein